MKKIRIVLADDHSVVRQGFRMILNAHSDLEIVGEAGNGREAVELAATLRPDVVVMDVAMPELNGIEATRRLTADNPHVRVVALSMHKDSVYVREILRAGARGYLLKDSVADDLVAAIRAVAARRRLPQPGRLRRRADRLPPARDRPHRPADQPRARGAADASPRAKRTKRSPASLNLSVYTVDAHRGRIMEKLNLHSTGELVRFAVRKGLVD